MEKSKTSCRKILRVLLTGIVVITLHSIVHAQPCKEVVGYYPNWQWYKRNHLVNPKTIDYSKYTVINYCFFQPNADGTIAQTDTWADENILFGDHDWANGGYKPNTSLIDLAHKAGVKVMVSIGGWTLSGNFPAIAADPALRAVFGKECARLLSTFNFDGIDIDWEYPGLADIHGSPADKGNFTLLMQSIRSNIDAYGLSKGKTELLSAAFSADSAKAVNIEWAKVKNTINMINLMTYDFNGAWDSISNHNSPLFSEPHGNTTFNINSAFKMLTGIYGVSPGQINLGMGFYGRSFANCHGLFKPHTGSDTGFYSEDAGTPVYYNIVKKFGTFTRYWDDVAKVPYAIGGPSFTFVSYDDSVSIGAKADYIVKNQARGCIIWEMTGDYIEGATGFVARTPLASKIKEVFCGIPTSITEATAGHSTSFSIYPNPVSEELTVKSEGAATISIVNIAGMVVMEKNAGPDVKIDFQHMAKGIYICLLKNNENQVIDKKLFIH
jgi:chitinase